MPIPIKQAANFGGAGVMGMEEKETSNKQSAICQLEGELKLMEDQLDEAYRDFGRSMIEIMDEEGGKINALVDRIIEKSIELKNLRKERMDDDRYTEKE